MKPWLSYLLVVVAVIIVIVGVKLLSNREPIMPKVLNWPESPAMTTDINKRHTVGLATSEGTMTIELFTKEVPVTVNNFIFLARAGFYDGTKFHRIIKDFMIQGGDPKGDGTGGPGYRFTDEKITRDYKRGIVAMANAGPNTNGSQFFIMHQDYSLPKNYVIFGQLVDGFDVLDRIANTPVAPNERGEPSQPLKDVIVTGITVNESD